MLQSFEMKKAVHEEKRESIVHFDAVFSRLTLRAADIEKNLTFIFRQREGEYIGRVYFIAILLVDRTRELIAADNE